MPKTCQNRYYNIIRGVLGKINDTTLKIGHLAKAIAHTMSIAFPKWSVWVKN